MGSAIHDMVQKAYTNYESGMQIRSKGPDTRSLLHIVRKDVEEPEYQYGQSVYVVRGLHIDELLVYGYNAEALLCCRLNGVRTKALRSEAICTDRKQAEAMLEQRVAANTHALSCMALTMYAPAV